MRTTSRKIQNLLCRVSHARRTLLSRIPKAVIVPSKLENVSLLNLSRFSHATNKVIDGGAVDESVVEIEERCFLDLWLHGSNGDRGIR